MWEIPVKICLLERQMQTQGYMIVLKPDTVLERYLRVGDSPGRTDYLCQLRLAFPGVDPKRYLGISRDPLSAIANLDQKTVEWYRALGDELGSNLQARYRFRQLIGDMNENYNAHVEEDLLASQSDAQQVLDMLEDAGRWEVIHLSRGSPASSLTTLGFDIGNWFADHFSLIADTIITPRWHPAAPEDFGELKEA